MRKSVSVAIIVVGVTSVSYKARAANFSFECVDLYAAYSDCPGPPLNNRCSNTAGLASTLTAAGHTQLSTSYSDQVVYSGDAVESDRYSYGNDTSYTDTLSSDLWYWSGHGVCNNILNEYCDESSACSNPSASCDYVAHSCSTYADGYIFTCSTGDNNTGSAYGTHSADQSTQMSFGESPATGGWAGVGTNGNADVVVFDSSCPMALNWLIQRNANIFAGAHVELGFSGEGGDTADISERGSAFAARLVDGEAVGPAWLDTSHLDVPYGLNGQVCVIAMSCDNDEANATWRVNDEPWPYEYDPTASYSWCQWNYWCNF